MEMIPSPRLGFLRRVFLANHLASTDNLNLNNQRTEHIATKTNDIYRGPNNQQYN